MHRWAGLARCSRRSSWGTPATATAGAGIAISAAAPRTVNKHLEQIFVKLGVENRAFAAARAVRALAR
jgi:hypothetical protein